MVRWDGENLLPVMPSVGAESRRAHHFTQQRKMPFRSFLVVRSFSEEWSEGGRPVSLTDFVHGFKWQAKTPRLKIMIW